MLETSNQETDDFYRSASRLSTELHADKHAREGHLVDQAVQSAPRLSNFGSGVTLFIAAWPVQAFFLAFLALTGWTQIAMGLLVWFLTVYTITVSFGMATILNRQESDPGSSFLDRSICDGSACHYHVFLEQRIGPRVRSYSVRNSN